MIRKILSLLKNKIFIVGILILIQLAVLLTVVFTLSEYFIWIYFTLIILSLLVSLYILQRDDNPMYKISWIIMIMALPVFGGLLYLLFGGQKVPKELRIRDDQAFNEFKEIIGQNEEITNQLRKESATAIKQANYLWRNAGYPIYKNTQATYYPSGESGFEEMLEAIKNAKKYIFIEYFIIHPGIMWDTILDVLIEKAKEGIDVRLIYDDFGCITTLPSDYVEILKRHRIKAKAFNPIRAQLAIQMNNRDHRKIIAIDGIIGFTGGINLADEYINQKERFGYWKDNIVKLQGEAVWSLTVMFLQFWNYNEEQKDDILSYKLDDQKIECKEDGYIQPFADAPTDDENVGEYTHINMINGANQYVYTMTPYLILDHEMKTALTLAAKNGIDVRILVPHIPDKKTVFEVTRSNYKVLLKAGVRIYEYLPGFVHGKTFVSDDEAAIVGTVNMDYRSYYLHYECGVYFYKSSIVKDIKEDYLQALQQSKEITLEDCEKVGIFRKIYRIFLSLFAPLM